MRNESAHFGECGGVFSGWFSAETPCRSLQTGTVSHPNESVDAG